jgi:hypothetical protein
LYSGSYTDSNSAAITGSGQWGIANVMFGTGRDIPILSIKTYKLINQAAFTTNKEHIKLGDSLIYTITAPETSVVTLSDNK